MIKVGDKLAGVFPSTFTPEEKGLGAPGPWSGTVRRIPVEARVCYIHPKLRYVTIEFRFSHGASFRECLGIRRRKR